MRSSSGGGALITRLDLSLSWPYWLLVAVVIVSLIATRLPHEPGDMLCLAGLFVQSFSHMRNVPLFAIGAAILATPHMLSAMPSFSDRSTRRRRPTHHSRLQSTCPYCPCRDCYRAGQREVRLLT